MAATIRTIGLPILATTVSDLKQKLGEVLDVIMMFGFLFGVILIIHGAWQIRRGEIEAGKSSIIAGALIAAAPAIMRLLYGIFVENGNSTL